MYFFRLASVFCSMGSLLRNSMFWLMPSKNNCMALATCRISRSLPSTKFSRASRRMLSITSVATTSIGTQAMVAKPHVSFCLMFISAPLTPFNCCFVWSGYRRGERPLEQQRQGL